MKLLLYGKIEFYNGLKIAHPDFDVLNQSNNQNMGKSFPNTLQHQI